MPRYPLDRRERATPDVSRDLMEDARNPHYNTYDNGMPMNRPPLSAAFAGREGRFVFDDGRELQYKFKDKTTLSWFLPGVGGGWQEEYYECYESTSKNLYFLFHDKKDGIPPACRAFAIDLDNNLVTMLYCRSGIEGYTNKDVEIIPFFGYADWGDGAEPPTERHHYSTDMVRKAVMWRVNNWCLIHYYVSKSYFVNQVMIGQEGLVATEPARHIKLRDNVYLFHWVEMTGPGGMGTDIMDFNTLTGVGLFYGCGGGWKVLNGFQREAGKFLSIDDLIKFEHVFAEKGERAAMEAMGVDLSDITTRLIHV